MAKIKSENDRIDILPFISGSKKTNISRTNYNFWSVLCESKKFKSPNSFITWLIFNSMVGISSSVKS